MRFVPLHYAMRSLFRRRAGTLLTISSIAATVAVLAGMLALQQGFANIFTERGRTDLAILLRPGAGTEGESSFPRDRADILIKSTPEFRADEKGQPMAAAELYLAIRRNKVGGGETNVPIRGVQPQSFAIHGDDFNLVEGELPRPGTDEVIVGRRLVDRIGDCSRGSVMTINVTPFRVVGVFAAKGAYESEVWGDADRLMNALERRTFNRVIGVLKTDTDLSSLTARLEGDRRVPAKVMSERDYLQKQTAALSVLFVGLGTFLAVVMGLAAAFTGTNSMLSAVSARTHEIGILLAMGYRGLAIFLSFLVEALLLGLLGGALGCLLVLPLHGVQTGTTNFQTFSEVAFAFQVNWRVLLAAVLFAIGLGLLGGAFPAARAARLRPTVALRRT